MSSKPEIHKGEGTGRGSAGLGVSIRLSLVYALLFSLGGFVVFTISYFLVAAALEQQELDAVRDRVREYRAWYLEGGLPALRDRFREKSANTPENLFLRVTGVTVGEALFYSKPGASGVPGPEELQQLGSDINRSRLSLGEGHEASGRWTVVTAELPGGAWLQAGKSSHYLDRTLARFRRIFLFTLIPVMLVGIGISTAVAFRALKPIRRLIETMKNILATGDLGRRTPETAAGNELNDLSILFNDLLDRNQRLVATTRESLDAVAHDLRTPMTRLRNVAEQALADPEVSVPGGKALETCLEESENALSLLRSLTEIAEAEAGVLRLELDDHPVAGIVGHVVDLYEFVAEDRGITLKADAIPEDLTVRADRTRLQQILANLVDNAIKYSPDDSTVTITASGNEEAIRISVADEGPGIPMEDLPRIFDRLYRGDASRSKTPGLGLGLSLVKAVAEAHGGTVSVKSTPGKGAVFTLLIPGSS